MLAKQAIQNGGYIVPIILDKIITGGTGVMNPSIFNDNGKLLLNVRNVNYAIYHCHNFFQRYGPLQYIHEEQLKVLATKNILVHLDDTLNPIKYQRINTDRLDEPSQWEFTGLEDARLVKWGDDFYLIGVRRDNNPTGKGRMEMSKIDINTFEELDRELLPAPGLDNTYCEKNWMPILDRSFGFVKWTAPTEVAYRLKPGKVVSTTVETDIKPSLDLRGGSQVLDYSNHYIAIVHEAALFQSQLGQKDAIYRHRFVCWDKDFNLKYVSEPFNFLGGKIEFCTGACFFDKYLLISFGRQDNSAYILALPLAILDSYLS